MGDTARQWIKVLFFAAGVAFYVVLFAWFLAETFGGDGNAPPSFGAFEATALTLSAAVGGYLAKLLGVPPPPNSESFLITPRIPSPETIITVLVAVAAIAYVVIGIVAGVAEATQPAERVPAVVSAQWKIVLGFVIATFVGVLGDRTRG